MASHLETVFGAIPVLQKHGSPAATFGALAGGALAGGLVFRRHRALGAVATGLAASNIPDAMFGNGERILINLIHIGASVGGSLLWKKHPALGFLGPYVGIMATRALIIKK